eukprot:jgi/Mesen1/2102/ME000151S01364
MKLSQCSKQLGKMLRPCYGKLVKIMDPQMDAGMKPDKYLSVEEALEGGLAPLDLSTRELIDVMDQLLACEATWHRGVSLAQTVYTCLYVLRVDRTAPNPLLHGYCRAVRATCNAIRALVCRADVYEVCAVCSAYLYL